MIKPGTIKRALLANLDHYWSLLELRALAGDRFYGHKNLVFVDQLAGVDETQVASEYGEITDDKACQRFGTPTLKEFSFWAWRACGLAGVAMILKATVGFEGALYDLVREGLRLNGYAFKNRQGVDVGWKHQALVTILRRRGLRAKVVQGLSITGLMTQLARGRYILASVKSERGGHLVLVAGVTLRNESKPEFLVNDSYSFNGQGGENCTLSHQEFQEAYLERGVIAWSETERQQHPT